MYYCKFYKTNFKMPDLKNVLDSLYLYFLLKVLKPLTLVENLFIVLCSATPILKDDPHTVSLFF